VERGLTFEVLKGEGDSLEIVGKDVGDIPKSQFIQLEREVFEGDYVHKSGKNVEKIEEAP